MRTSALPYYVTVALVCAGWSPAGAQTGVLVGQVIDAGTGEPIESVTIQVSGAGETEAAGGMTSATGRFRFEVPAGTYTIVATRLGYETRRMPGIRVGAGEERQVEVAMVSRAVELNPIVVTASRTEETRLDAPATVVVVEKREIEEQAAPTVIDHVKGQVGVDVAQTGIQQSNVVTRGFNNVFSGAMLVLADYRYARVPSLRLNAYNLIPTTNLDLDHVEVVLGPGAALYGPNSANGVLHMITTSPIDAPGTSVSLAGGEQSIFHGQFRHAAKIGERSGIKVSGQYFRGDDFRFIDPSEETARADALPDDPDTRIGLRDFDAARWTADIRFDTRPWDDGEIVVAGGANTLLSSIELTGIGAGQAEDWRYTYGQVRVRKGRLFAQSFINMSDAGDTFLLRTGQPIVDESFFLAGQVQHGLAIGEREDLLYGIDIQRTEPRTKGTITGRNEDDDTIHEIGGYVHSETWLTDELELLGALRLDWHNRLEDLVLSPRAGLVWTPEPNQNVRLTFNRAFGTPTTNNLFLDIVGGRIPLGGGLGFDIRTRGTPESGFTFGRECPGGTLGGLCMRSPFVPGRLPANAALAWNTLLQVAVAQGVLPPELLPLLQSDNPPIETALRRFDPELLTFVEDEFGPEDIARLEPTISNAIEVGYKGVLGGRVLLVADVYRSDITDFITPLRVETPSVFLDPATTAAFLLQRLTPLVQAGQLTPQQLAAIVQQATEAVARVPIGTVVPEQSDTPDILLAYRNFGELDLWGADFAAEVLLGDAWTLRGTYSWVSEECFDFDDNGTCEDLLDVALNAPQNKGSIGLRYDDPDDRFAAEAAARFVSEFVMNSGVYVGTVDGYGVLDANFEYRFPGTGVAVGATAYNLFDHEHREFVGAPEMGRILLLKLRYDTQ